MKVMLLCRYTHVIRMTISSGHRPVLCCCLKRAQVINARRYAIRHLAAVGTPLRAKIPATRRLKTIWTVCVPTMPPQIPGPPAWLNVRLQDSRTCCIVI